MKNLFEFILSIVFQIYDDLFPELSFLHLIWYFLSFLAFNFFFGRGLISFVSSVLECKMHKRVACIFVYWQGEGENTGEY